MVRLLSLFNTSSHNASVCVNKTEVGSAFTDEGVYINEVIDDSRDKLKGIQLKCKFQDTARDIYIWDDVWKLKFTERSSGSEYVFKISKTSGEIRLVVTDTGIIIFNDSDEALSIFPVEEHYKFYKMFFDQGKWVVKASEN
ncbi:hypothetical protein TB2_004499 [Malus domestica]|uniref:Uncharacterized protein n=1 Tax=Malus domestica TaxID=3750 RepID=A0A498IXC0_MALDO|nr:hypothetical protein DVH24_022230 [Malus domestica]